MSDLRTAAQQAIALICSARLCEVNSMSSRQEMLRLLIEATDTLRAALAQPEPDTDCHTQGICQRSGYGIGRQTDPQIEDRLARHGIPKP